MALSILVMAVAYVMTSAGDWLAQGRSWPLWGLPRDPLLSVVVALVVGIATLVAAMVGFTRAITDRLSIVADNAERISRHQPLRPVATWSGEISRLARSHETTAAMLTEQEGELLEAVAAAEQANRSKGEFLSRVSHELRTPLNAVLGFGQLLQLDDLSTDQEESVGHILRAGRHLLDLIDELLEVARDEASVVPVALERLRVTDIIEEAITFTAPLAEARRITLHADQLADATHLGVLGDRQRILQVLLNLLSNAVKYNHDGGMIIIDCHEGAAATVQIEVTDTGLGLDVTQLDRVFTPFDRLGAEGTDVEGTGVGLSLSLSLAQAMGGTILVDSAIGIGSTFVLELPSAPPPRRANTRPVPDLAGATRRRGEEVKQAASGSHRILYVEDNEPIGKRKVRGFRSHGQRIGKQPIQHYWMATFTELLETPAIVSSRAWVPVGTFMGTCALTWYMPPPNAGARPLDSTVAGTPAIKTCG